MITDNKQAIAELRKITTLLCYSITNQFGHDAGQSSSINIPKQCGSCETLRPRSFVPNRNQACFSSRSGSSETRWFTRT